jgi:hypothetical protein
VSLVVTVEDGCFWRCDGCLGPISSHGLVLHRPLKPIPGDQPECLTVHEGCTKEPLIQTLLPAYTSMPLAVVMRQLGDALALQ